MAPTIFQPSFTPKFPNPQNDLSLPASGALTLPPIKPTIICSVFANNAETGGGDLRVIFAAGGTGGHISPAVAIADELKTRNPQTQILFVGNPKGMERTAVPSAGYEFAALATTPLTRPLFSPQNLFLLPYRLTKSLIQSWRQLHRFNPQIVVGTGGYVSFPVCFVAAAFKGVKLVIQEQNSVPGIANWVLSLFADKVFVAFDLTRECFPRKDGVVVCGNPVRLSLRKQVSKVAARMHFFPRSVVEMGESDAMVVLVLGGSLGANAINIALWNLYYQMLMRRKNLFIIWQTGVEAFDEMESLVKSHSHLVLTPRVKRQGSLTDNIWPAKRCFSNYFKLQYILNLLKDNSQAVVNEDIMSQLTWIMFLHSMDLAYAAADLVVSRAGAMTCYEILATGKPSILVINLVHLLTNFSSP
ncbi:hypothetical protein RHMOL_Rhmol08G0170200 [Rhododendron molle]|uniref:Uncharacterized protein n=1 Tax=Rhododendron molle TaxID=49168 RepID=A0ACC0MR93_RHOML|nr:hypothetical protein RHMOL_Rhmol08G0170200 [Rhododendron molle]